MSYYVKNWKDDNLSLLLDDCFHHFTTEATFETFTGAKKWLYENRPSKEYTIYIIKQNHFNSTTVIGDSFRSCYCFDRETFDFVIREKVKLDECIELLCYNIQYIDDKGAVHKSTLKYCYDEELREYDYLSMDRQFLFRLSRKTIEYFASFNKLNIWKDRERFNMLINEEIKRQFSKKFTFSRYGDIILDNGATIFNVWLVDRNEFMYLSVNVSSTSKDLTLGGKQRNVVETLKIVGDIAVNLANVHKQDISVRSKAKQSTEDDFYSGFTISTELNYK